MIAAAWIAVTAALYAAARALHRRFPRPWLTPLLVVPGALAAVLVAARVPYPGYMRGGRLLVDLLGPATVAFALPLHRHAGLLRRHAAELGVGILVGCAVAVGSSFLLARALGLARPLALSLAPRSITTPFAMQVAGDLGGVPALAAVFVILTAVVGLVVGQLLVRWLPLRSAVARGALYGMGAHAAGTAQAMELGRVEGAVAGVVMIVAGLGVLVATPLLARLL